MKIMLKAPEVEHIYLTQKCYYPTIEGVGRQTSSPRKRPDFSPNSYANTFEFELNEHESIRSIVLKTKWRYNSASIFGDNKFITSYYPELNDMIAQLTLPEHQHSAYLRMTGRGQNVGIQDGQVDLMFPLTLAGDAFESFGTLSLMHKKFKVEYDFPQPSLETKLYVQIVVRS